MIRSCLAINKHKLCVVSRLIQGSSSSSSSSSSSLYYTPSTYLSSTSTYASSNYSATSSYYQPVYIKSRDPFKLSSSNKQNKNGYPDVADNFDTTGVDRSFVPFQDTSTIFKQKEGEENYQEDKTNLSGVNVSNVRFPKPKRCEPLDNIFSLTPVELYESLVEKFVHSHEFTTAESDHLVDQVAGMIYQQPDRVNEYSPIITLFLHHFVLQEEKLAMLTVLTSLCSRCGLAPQQEAFDIVYQFLSERDFDGIAQIHSPVFLQSLLERSARDNNLEWLETWQPPGPRTVALPLVYNQVTNRKDLYNALIEKVFVRMDRAYVQRVIEKVITEYMLIENAQPMALEWYCKLITGLNITPNLNTLLVLKQDNDESAEYWDHIKTNYVIGTPILERENKGGRDLLDKITSSYRYIKTETDNQLEENIINFDQQKMVDILKTEYFAKNRMPSGNLLIRASMVLFNRRPNYYLYHFTPKIPSRFRPLMAMPWQYCAIVEQEVNDGFSLLSINDIDKTLILQSEAMWNSLVMGLIKASQWETIAKILHKMVDEKIRIKGELVKDLSSCMLNFKRSNRSVAQALLRYQSRMKFVHHPRINNISILAFNLTQQFSIAKSIYDHSSVKNLMTYRLVTMLFLDQLSHEKCDPQTTVDINVFEQYIGFNIGFGTGTELNTFAEILIEFATPTESERKSILCQFLVSQIVNRECEQKTPFFLKLRELSPTDNGFDLLQGIIASDVLYPAGTFDAESEEFIKMLTKPRAQIRDKAERPQSLTEVSNSFIKLFLDHTYLRTIRIKD